MTGGVGDPLVQNLFQGVKTPVPVGAPPLTPNSGGRPDRPGQAGPDRQRPARRRVRDLALRRRRHPRRRVRRPLRHQGQRRELDRRPAPERAARLRHGGPGPRPEQQHRPGQLQHHRRAGELRLRPGRRPDQPEHHLHRRQRRLRADDHDPGRHHPALRPVLALRLERDARRPDPQEHHQPGHDQGPEQPHPRGPRSRSPTPSPTSTATRSTSSTTTRRSSSPTRATSPTTARAPGGRRSPGSSTGPTSTRSCRSVDPTTGKTRLLVGYDQGIATGVDNNGTLLTSIGSQPLATGVANGNLQITQFYNGAAQPSALAAAGRRRPVLRRGPGRRVPDLRPERPDQRQHRLVRPDRRRDRRRHRRDRLGDGVPVQSGPAATRSARTSSSRSTASAGPSACSSRPACRRAPACPGRPTRSGRTARRSTSPSTRSTTRR